MSSRTAKKIRKYYREGARKVGIEDGTELIQIHKQRVWRYRFAVILEAAAIIILSIMEVIR